MKKMYSRSLITFAVLAVLLPITSLAQYCTPSYTNPCNTFGNTDYIQSFSTSGGITNINNPNTLCGSPGNGNYTYYSSMSHTALPGSTVTFTVTNTPDYNERFIMWVDWNQDNTFSSTEQVAFTVLTTGQVYTSSFVVPSNAVVGTTRMRIRNVFSTLTTYDPCTNYTWGEAEDYNFIVQSPTPCSGTPSVSINATGTIVCAPGTVTLTATPGNNAPGYTYQWQSAPECTNNFTNIPNATNTTYTVTQASLSGYTQFRAVITCSASGLSANSNTIFLYPGCYCTSAASVGSGADIGYINVTTPGYPTFAYPATPPASYVSVGTATGSYTNLSGLSTFVSLVAGATSNFYVTQINSTPTQSPSYLKIYVDFNRDGDFTDPGEESDPGVGSSTTPSATTISGTIAVPASATPGATRMRAVLVQGGSAATVAPCGNYTQGETEDYRAYIQPIVAPVTASNNGPLCPTATIQLSASTTSSCASYSWTGPGFTSTQQNPTIPNATAANAGVYTVTATSPYGLNVTSSTTVVINPASTSSATASLCQGSSLTFGSQTITTGGTYTQTFTTAGGCDSIVTLTVTLIPKPSPPAVTTPVTYCQGVATAPLTATGASILWYTSATGGTGSSAAPTPSSATPGTTKYYVSQTVNGCESARDSITVVVNPTPAIYFVSSANPIACGGNSGSITIGGLTPGTVYAIAYMQGSTAAGPVNISSNVVGNLVITGLTQGNYSNITATINSCASNAIGPVLLTDPPMPAVPVASGNSPLCQGSTLTLNATSTTPGVTFTWNGPSSFFSNLSSPSITNVQAANAGVYSVTATLNSCTSAAGTTTIVVNPLPVIGATSLVHPSTCGGTNGSISLNGLTPGTTYTIHYNTTNVSLTANASGIVIIPNLGAGVYSNITATLNNCTSSAVGPFTLNNPPTPAAPVVSNNGPLCLGNTLNLTASAIAGATYSWSGPGPYTSSTQNPTIASVTTANAGVYTVTATVAGCTSLSSATTVVINPTPVISNATGSNPTTCGGVNGSISLTGLTPGTTYSISYSQNLNPPTTASLTSNSTGVITVSGLGAGTYSSITATLNGCSSLPAGPVTLSSPATPVIGGTTFSNPTACGSSNGSITLTGLNNSTGYTVSYSLNGGTPVVTVISSNSSGTLVIPSLGAGTYSNITVTLNGCTSAASGPVTLSNPSTPPQPAPTNNGPLCAGSTLNLSTTAVAGATYSWSGPGFSSAAQNPSITNVTTAASGIYTVTVTVNNCTSTPGATAVVVNPMPAITTTSVSHPATCGGTNGSITLNGLAASTSYSVTYTWGSTPSTVSLTSNISGTVVIPNLGAGTYSNITVTLGSCTSTAVGPFTLNNPPTPAAPVASNNGPLCAGATLNLTASAVPGATYSWVGPVSFSSALQNPSISGAAAGNSGVYSVTATVNNCTSAAATTSVTVYPVPVISAATGNNPTSCNGTNGSISLTGLSNNTTYTISYTLNSNPATTISATSNGAGTATIGNLGTGTYSGITVTLNGCTSAPAGPVTLVNPSTPATPTASNNGPVCQDGVLNLSTPAVAGATYTWSGPGPFSSTAQNATITGVAVTAAGTYSVTVTVNGCTSAPGTTTVVVHPTPAAPVATTNAPICEGSTLTLNAGNITGASYSWTGPGYSASTQNPVIAGAGTAASGIYSVIATVNNCPSLAGTVSVTVHPIPAAPAVSNVTYCQFLPTVPLMATGQNLLWYTVPAGGTGSSTAPVPSSGSFGTTTWYVSQSVNGCESPRAAISVTVIQAPALPVVTSPIEYCQYEPATQLAATGVGLQWYIVQTGGTPLSAAPTPSTLVPGTYTWYVSQYDGGCEGDRAPINVIVHPKPDTPFVPNPLLFCVNDSSAAINLPGLTWYASATGGTGSAVIPAVDISAAGTNVYYVTKTQNNCESDRSMVIVTVNENVAADVVLDNSVICQFDTITVSNVGVNPSSAVYNWNFDGAIVINGGNAGPYQVTWNTPGNKTVSLTISNFNCTDNDAETLLVKPSPSGTFEIKPDACVGEEMYVQASWTSLNIAEYDWDFAGAAMLNSASGAGAYRLMFETPGVKAISLTTSGDGCSSQPFLDTIVIHEAPVAKIMALNGDKICQGSELVFRAEGEIVPGYAYLWMPFDHFITNGVSQVTGIARSAGFVQLQVIDEFGCKGADSMFVNAEPCCTVALPGAFSPNNDGKNDQFRIISDGRQQISVFRVVNRWGQTVFESGDSRSGWDGTFNGKPQDMGTYYYYLRYKCGTDETFEKRGEITLIR